jgi:hypothetical protein
MKLNSMKLTLSTVTTVSRSPKSALESFPGPVICCPLQMRVILARPFVYLVVLGSIPTKATAIFGKMTRNCNLEPAGLPATTA